MASVDVDGIKAALRTWVINGSGLAPNKVIWTLGRRSPTGTYVHLRMKIDPVGGDVVSVRPNPTPTPGNDAIYSVLGARYGTVTITCFAPDDVEADARSPEEILNDVMTASSLPSSYDVLTAARVGVLTFSSVTTVDLTIDEVQFEPRAYFTARFHTTAQLSETGAAIDTVDLVGTTDAATLTFEVDANP
jgi:hypothetical protein